MLNDIVLGELKKKYSIKGSNEKILNNMITDYQKGTLSLSQFQNSNVDFQNLNKKQIHKMLKDYEAAQKKKYADLDVKDLKKKFDVTKSQEKDLDKMVEDLKKGKLSATVITEANVIDPKKLDQDKINSMIQKYRTRPSFVAKKFSLQGSKQRLLQNFIQNFNKGKSSATKVARDGFDPKKLNKQQLLDILDRYEAGRRIKPLFMNSKFKLQDLLDDIGSNSSIVDQARRMFAH